MLHVRSWGTSIFQAGCYCSSANASSYGVWASSDIKTFSLWSDEVCHLVWDQFIIVSDSPKLDQLLSSDVRSPSVHTVSDLGNGLSHRVHTSSRGFEITHRIYMLCFPFISINLTFPRGDAAFITPPGLSSFKVDWELGPSFTLEKLSHWYHSLNISQRRGELVHQFFFPFRIN